LLEGIFKVRLRGPFAAVQPFDETMSKCRRDGIEPIAAIIDGKATPASINQPLTPGPSAVHKTIIAVTADLIAPRCLVP
jgi:hypothetical protein